MADQTDVFIIKLITQSTNTILRLTFGKYIENEGWVWFCGSTTLLNSRVSKTFARLFAFGKQNRKSLKRTIRVGNFGKNMQILTFLKHLIFFRENTFKCEQIVHSNARVNPWRRTELKLCIDI